MGFKNKNRAQSVGGRGVFISPVTSIRRGVVHTGGFSRFSRVPYLSSDYAGDGYGADDIGLGKFKLKNVVKSVTKAATQVAKVAVKPAAIVAASSLNAVGLKKVAAKTGKSLGLTHAEQNIAKSGGKAIQIGAAATAAVVAAPYAGAALTAAGKGALIAGKFVATKGLVVSKALQKTGLVQKAVGLFAKNKAQETASGETPADSGAGPSPMDFSGVSAAVRQITSADGGQETSESARMPSGNSNFSPAPGGPAVPSDEAGAPEEGAPDAPQGTEGVASKSPLSILLPIGAALLLL